MSSHTTFATRLRFVGAVAAAGVLAMGGLPAFAAPTDAPADAASCVRLRLDNPHPGDVIPAGDYTISGQAVDTSGVGIVRVQLFLEDRNLGGTPIGEADLNPPQNAPASVAQSSLGGNGVFSVLVDTSSSNTDVGSHTIFAYATSTNGTEVSIAVPILLAGKSTGPASVSPTGAGGALGTGQPSVSSSADCPGAAAQPETISVTINSPHAGATISKGKNEVSGRATTTGNGGIDRIQVFLGNRDLGGISLGEITAAGSPVPVPNSATLSNTLNSDGTYRLFVDYPAQNLGSNTVFVYARAGASQKEGSATTSVIVQR